MLVPNRAKQKLQSGGALLGVMLTLKDPSIAEILALSGMDYLCIDCEHTLFNEETIMHIVRAAHLHGTMCLIRPETLDHDAIGRLMDIGCDGIMAPDIETAAQARAVVEAVKFAPMGRRAIAPTCRAAHFGCDMDAAAFAAATNEHTVVCVIIESIDGLRHLDEILAVDGIDVFVVGPNDLASSMGLPGQKDHPDVQREVMAAAAKVKAAGKAFGGVGGTPQEIRHQIEDNGFMDINVGSDQGLLRKAAMALTRDFRA